MISLGADGSVSIWDMNNFTHIESIDEPGNQIGAMDFANDGITFATAGKVTSLNFCCDGCSFFLVCQ